MVLLCSDPFFHTYDVWSIGGQCWNATKISWFMFASSTCFVVAAVAAAAAATTTTTTTAASVETSRRIDHGRSDVRINVNFGDGAGRGSGKQIQCFKTMLKSTRFIEDLNGFRNKSTGLTVLNDVKRIDPSFELAHWKLIADCFQYHQGQRMKCFERGAHTIFPLHFNVDFLFQSFLCFTGKGQRQNGTGVNATLHKVLYAPSKSRGFASAWTGTNDHVCKGTWCDCSSLKFRTLFGLPGVQCD